MEIMKKSILYIIAILYLLTFFLPFALGADPYSFGTVTVTGIDYMIAQLQAFGLLLIFLVAYFLSKKSTLLLVLVGLTLLYLYGSPFYVSTLGSMTYFTFLKTLLMDGLKYGYYISALLALAGYIILWKKHSIE